MAGEKGVKPKDPFAVELGLRIDEAWVRAGYANRSAFFRDTNLPDYNQLAKWARGAAVPNVQFLAEIARVCRVSLDWLVFGAEETPAALLDWLETEGHRVEPEAKQFLRSLPTHGYKATRAFYDLAYQSWKLGLVREMSAEEAAQMARDTERVQAKRDK